MASNLCASAVALRVGADDESVPPYYSRRLYRLLEDACPGSATFDELPGKGHWWWDSAFANDGGAVNDAALRRFFSDRFRTDAGACPVGFTQTVPSVDAVLGSVHR
jgi:hypothetical protein